MSAHMVSAEEAQRVLKEDEGWRFPVRDVSRDDLAHTVVVQAEQIAAVLALHKPTPVHQYDDVNGVFVYGEHDKPVTIHLLCEGCTWDQSLEALGDCEWSEDLDGNVYWPCPTARALGATA